MSPAQQKISHRISMNFEVAVRAPTGVVLRSSNLTTPRFWSSKLSVRRMRSRGRARKRKQRSYSCRKNWLPYVLCSRTASGSAYCCLVKKRQEAHNPSFPEASCVKLKVMEFERRKLLEELERLRQSVGIVQNAYERRKRSRAAKLRILVVRCNR